MNHISILIADDHQLFRSGIINILKSNDLFVIAGEAADGFELVESYKLLSPDIIIVDISMPGLSGVEAVKRIKQFDPTVKALFLSMYDGEEYVYAVLVSGGLGLISKNITRQELFDAVTEVSKGKKYFKGYSDEQLEEIENKFYSYRDTINLEYDTLTDREKEVLYYIGLGHTSSEIAAALRLSKRTVDSYRTNIIEKLNLKSLPDLVRFAIQFTALHKDYPKAAK